MRTVFRVLIVGLLLSAGAAEAKDSKKKKDKEDEGILPTGITAFDSVFERVGEIDGRLRASESQLRTGKSNLNSALELKRGTPISDGITQLRERAGNKVTFAIDNRSMPKLTADSAVPTNVSDAVDAVNAMTGNFTTSLVELQALAPEIDRLVKESKKMPARLKDEFTKEGGGALDKLFTLPKVSKALTHDIGITVGLAERTTSLTTRMTDVLGVVQTEFGRGTTGGAPGSGTNPAKQPPVAKKPAPKKKN